MIVANEPNLMWKNGRFRPLILFVLGLILLLGLMGCDNNGPPDSVTVITTTPTFTPTATSVPTKNPVVATLVTATPPTPSATPDLNQTPTPTPAGCPPPAEWEAYSIQAGDTLWGLAQETEATVPAIVAANCLPDENVVLDVGDTVYLPFAPPVAAGGSGLPAAPITVTPVQACNPALSSFCKSAVTAGSEQGSLSIDPGGGDYQAKLDFVPCEGTGEALEFDTTTQEVEIGQRRYLYVCREGAVISATLTNSAGAVEALTLLETMPNPDFQSGNMSYVIDRPILPGEPLGFYEVNLTFDTGKADPFYFEVVTPTQEYVLVLSQEDKTLAGPVGSDFEIFFINFPHNQSIAVTLSGEDEPAITRGVHHMSYRDQWPMAITHPLTYTDTEGMGWGTYTLSSEPLDPAGIYAVFHEECEAENLGFQCSLIWLQPD